MEVSRFPTVVLSGRRTTCGGANAPKQLDLLRSSSANNSGVSGQPYSAYAVHLTTLSPPAIIGDGALIWLLWKAGQTWSDEQRHLAIYSLLTWMFVSKFSKNLGHYIRYPSDVALLPVSIMFGWFHGLIKLYAMVTLDVVSTTRHLWLSHSLVLSQAQSNYIRSAVPLEFRHSHGMTRPDTPVALSTLSFLLITLLDYLGQSSWSRYKL